MSLRLAATLAVSALFSVGFWFSLGTDRGPLDPRFRDLSWVHDFIHYYLPNAEYLGARLRGGDLPLWNPQQGLGAPFLATLQPGVLYPPNWLHALLPSVPAHAIVIAMHMALGAMGAAGLAVALGASSIGAVVSGFLFVTAPLMLIDVWQPPAYFASAWAPVVLWAVERVILLPTARRSVILAVVVALQILAGWPYCVALTALAAGIWAIVRLGAMAWARRGGALRASAALAGGVAAAGLLAAPVLLPAAELISRSCRPPGTLQEGQAIWVDVAHDPNIILSEFVSDGVTGGLAGFPALVLTLCAIALVPRGRRAGVWMLFGIGALALAASFPDHLPVYGWLRSAPLLGDFRFPFRYRMLTELSVAVLAGVGIGALQVWLARWPRTSTALACLAAILAMAPSVLSVPNRVVPYPRSEIARPSLEDDLNLGVPIPSRVVPPRLYWSDHQGRIGRPSPLHVVFDLEPLTLARTAQLLTFLETGRALTLDPKLRGRQNPGGNVKRGSRAPFYGHTVLPRTPARAAILDLMAVNWIAADPPPRWLERRHPRLQKGAGGGRVFANPGALPRAFWVGEAEREPPKVQDALERMTQRGFDMRRRALLEPLPSELAPQGRQLAGPPGSIVVESYEPERVRLRVRAGRAGAVVLADSWYPGWEATLDGGSVALLRANSAFRAVAVPAGDHIVEMHYRPASFRRGVGLAASAAVACVIALRVLRPRPERARS